MGGGFSSPDKLAVAVAFGEDAYEAWFAIEYALYIGGGDACVGPGCRYS